MVGHKCLFNCVAQNKFDFLSQAHISSVSGLSICILATALHFVLTILPFVMFVRVVGDIQSIIKTRIIVMYTPMPPFSVAFNFIAKSFLRPPGFNVWFVTTAFGSGGERRLRSFSFGDQSRGISIEKLLLSLLKLRGKGNTICFVRIISCCKRCRS